MMFTDPVTWLFTMLGRMCFRLGQGLMIGLKRLFMLSDQPRYVTEAPAENDTRLDGCQEVVMWFANHMGYIAREVITRDELEEKIDNGISKDDLVKELNERIDALPGVVLGTQMYQGWEVKLPYSWRDRHAYVVGKSGFGKTNFLRTMMFQDLREGNGIGILAPDQELLTEEILPYIPADRIDDVVYVNPVDLEYPVPFNPLHLDDDADIDLAADDLLTIFKRLIPDTGSRMDEILRQTFYALLERPGSTLLDIRRLLSPHDSSLRQEIIRTSTDEETIEFFRDIYPSYPKDAYLPITTRISKLTRVKVVRSLLCQSRQSLNFREAMDDGKILLFSLADGIIGEQTSQLLGQLIVAKIQMAVMSRADTPKAARRPFFLYLDEFSTFTGVNEKSYEKMLSRARKYKLGLILAHQQTGQLPSNLLKEIFGNVSTLIAFNVSYDDAQRLSREFIMDGEHLPPEMLLDLKIGEAWGKIGTNIFPLKTKLMDQNPDSIRAKEVIEQSRLNYGIRSDDNRKPPKSDEDDEEPLDPGEVF
jgi:hypothetical protein